jgi:hypothetical protein
MRTLDPHGNHHQILGVVPNVCVEIHARVFRSWCSSVGHTLAICHTGLNFLCAFDDTQHHLCRKSEFALSFSSYFFEVASGFFGNKFRSLFVERTLSHENDRMEYAPVGRVVHTSSFKTLLGFVEVFLFDKEYVKNSLMKKP